MRCDELRVYLESRNLSMFVSLSEDATRIVDKVQYDSTTNQLIGFVAKINEANGMPIPLNFPARNADEIFNHFSNENAVSTYVNVVMAQQLSKNATPFCLLVFGSDNTYSLKSVKDRWQHHIRAEKSGHQCVDMGIRFRAQVQFCRPYIIWVGQQKQS